MKKSNRQKREGLKTRRANQERREVAAGMEAGTILPVDKSKIVSRCAIPKVPDYYQDRHFTCKDCGKDELWTAKQQKRWYEEQGGEIESIAVRCRACRRKEKARREIARKVHLEGLARKRAKKPGE